MHVSKDILIEDLVEEVPGSVRYLTDKGIRCIMCGDPVWGTLEEAAKEKGFTDTDIQRFVTELEELRINPPSGNKFSNNTRIDSGKWSPNT